MVPGTTRKWQFLLFSEHHQLYHINLTTLPNQIYLSNVHQDVIIHQCSAQYDGSGRTNAFKLIPGIIMVYDNRCCSPAHHPSSCIVIIGGKTSGRTLVLIEKKKDDCLV